MASNLSPQQVIWPRLAWLSAALTGVGLPALTMLVIADVSDPMPLSSATSPLLAVGLMGMGMIAAATAGRFWVGLALALICGAALVLLFQAIGMSALPGVSAIGIAFVVASISFAARGALFAKSGGARGWWIALAVVAGEGAIIATAWAEPGAIPKWLLVLLPAQWATIAIQTSITEADQAVASAALVALGGTAAATMLVAKLWPKRWPYAVMFTTWIGLSAVVWHSGYADETPRESPPFSGGSVRSALVDPGNR